MELLTRIKKERMIARKDTSKGGKLRTSLLTTLVGEAETILKGKQAHRFDMLKLVEKFYKGVEDTLKVKYTEDLHEELCILDEYIPQKMSEEQIEAFVSPILADKGGIKEVMQYFNGTLKRQGAAFDNKTVQEVTKRLMK